MYRYEPLAIGAFATALLTSGLVLDNASYHKSHAALAASSYAVTGTVTSFSSTNSQAGSATDSDTITVDNYPSANASWGTITLKDQQVVINWSKPEDSNFKQVVILRSTSTISDAPTDVNT